MDGFLRMFCQKPEAETWGRQHLVASRAITPHVEPRRAHVLPHGLPNLGIGASHAPTGSSVDF